MRVAKLITKFIEHNSSKTIKLCEFRKTIKIADVPPIGYTVTFPEGNSISRFYIEGADIQNKSGNVTLYSTMKIQYNKNYDHIPSLLIMQNMKKLGWTVEKIHEDVKNKWDDSNNQITEKNGIRWDWDDRNNQITEKNGIRWDDDPVKYSKV
jgi:hypothetical protein